MQRIVYLGSTPTLCTPEEIAALLAVSRRNNAADGISGLRLHHDGTFLQVLEGEEPALSACFDRIARDPRHRQLIVLWRGPVASRAFPEWQMGYARLSELFQAQPGAVLSLHDIALSGSAAADPLVERLVGRFLDGFRDLGPVGAVS